MTSCDNSDHCAGEGTCESGACQALAPDGDNCTDPAECASGFCVDDVCCNTVCDGLCEECNSDQECVPKDGAPSSDCDGYDPDNVCSARCDGVQRDVCAALPGPEVRCQNHYCNGHTRGPASFCDGAGGCTTVFDAIQDCSPFICSPSAVECRTNCAGDVHCIDGYHCTPDGACEEDVLLTDACEESFDCGDGLACHESLSGEEICCPAASCPPCHSYDATCTCVQNDDVRCGYEDSRYCCGGECCASTGPYEGGCQDGACPMVCIPIGGNCDQVEEDNWSGFHCCQDSEYKSFCDYSLTWSAPGEIHTTCCLRPGGACTAGVGEPTPECCGYASEETTCGSDGRCGGVGAWCTAMCDWEDWFCQGPCASGVCCGLHCCADGEQCVGGTYEGKCTVPNGRSCATDRDCTSNLCCEGVCIDNSDEQCGGCRTACGDNEACAVSYDDDYLGGPRVVVEAAACKKLASQGCSTGDECVDGYCYEGFCCDECGGLCGRPRPDNTPCLESVDEFLNCCAGVCTSVRTLDNCSECFNVCEEPDVSCDETYGCYWGFCHPVYEGQCQNVPD